MYENLLSDCECVRMANMIRVSFSRMESGFFGDNFLFQFELGLLVVFLSLFQYPLAAVWRSASSVTKDISRLCTCVRQGLANW